MKSLFVLGLAWSALGSDVLRRQDLNNATLESCPGYSASNIQSDGSRLTADLSLTGPACNAYGDDLKDLRLEVEYQTSQYSHTSHITYQLTTTQTIVSTSRSTMQLNKYIKFQSRFFLDQHAKMWMPRVLP